MTHTAAALLAFMRQYIADNQGACPSYDEMARALNIRSKSTIGPILKQLEAEGRVKRLRARGSRAWDIVQEAA